MADSFKFWVRAKYFQVFASGLAHKWNPTDHSFDEIMCGRQIEQPFRFLNRLAGLDGNDSINSGSLDFTPQIGRQKVAAKPLERIINPTKFCGIVLPEMVMGINSHVRPTPKSCWSIESYLPCESSRSPAALAA